MKKSYIVDSIYNNMRIDRWIRNNIEKIPQSLIEKNLRNGKIKINNKKVRSSFKINLRSLFVATSSSFGIRGVTRMS